VSEDGHPQTITYFEEHTGAQPLQANLPDLPPNVFTNIPRVKPSDSVTVLLLDSLNTPLADQSIVRAQMLKYLKSSNRAAEWPSLPWERGCVLYRASPTIQPC
jgi:hypothetical protein